MSIYIDAVVEKYRAAVRQLKADMAARGLSGSAWTYQHRNHMRAVFGELVLREVDEEEDGEPLPDAIQLDAADMAIRGKA